MDESLIQKKTLKMKTKTLHEILLFNLQIFLSQIIRIN